MRIRVENLVSISEANQNFSRVARLVDDTGIAVVLKNNVPRYVVLAYDQLEAEQAPPDADAASVAAAIIGRHRDDIDARFDDGDTPMRYCETCEQLCDPTTPDGGCAECEGPLRAPRPGDPVLLVSAGKLKADMIAPLLDDLRIPYSKKSDLGVGFTMSGGSLIEHFRFYVPYGAYRKARALLEETFGEDEEIMHALR